MEQPASTLLLSHLATAHDPRSPHLHHRVFELFVRALVAVIQRSTGLGRHGNLERVSI